MPTIEKRFECNGYKCEVRIARDDYCRHRRGYVFVDESHPLYGVCGSELPEDFKPKVNGGITYSTKEGDKWVFGFDYCHCWNIPDPKLTDYTRPRFGENDIPDTLANAMKDCINLAEALKDYEGRDYVWTIDDWGFMSERKPAAINLQGNLYVPAQFDVVEYDPTIDRSSVPSVVTSYKAKVRCPVCGNIKEVNG